MALEESFSAQPLRSASTTHLGGVHHLAELADYIRVWFFGSCSPLFGFFVPLQHGIFLAKVHCGTILELSTLVLFGSSPACGFLRALHLRAF